MGYLPWPHLVAVQQLPKQLDLRLHFCKAAGNVWLGTWKQRSEPALITQHWNILVADQHLHAAGGPMQIQFVSMI